MKKSLILAACLCGLMIGTTGCTTIGDWCMSATTYTFVTDNAEAYAIKLANKKIDGLTDTSDAEKLALKALAEKKIKEAFALLDELKAKYDAAKAAKVANAAVDAAKTEAAATTTATTVAK